MVASTGQRTARDRLRTDPLISGAQSPRAIPGPVDHKTRYIRLVELPVGIKADVVRAALTSSFSGLAAEQQGLAAELGLPVYFFDKRTLWQRGTNENLHQYLPKNGNLRQFSQQDLGTAALVRLCI